MNAPLRTRSPIDDAADKLRSFALGLEEGSFIGSEDDVLGRLEVSRVTMRQAARLLEREGVLRVRRGINGGYFAARPSVEMVENIVCTYLDTLGLDSKHTGGVATALWMETLRQAANADRGATRALTEELALEFNALPADATLNDISKLEQSSRSRIFRLIEGAYIEVFFRINSTFSRMQVAAEVGGASGVRQHFPQFLDRWRKAKLMELEAIAEGDEMLAMMTALHTRKVWLSRKD